MNEEILLIGPPNVGKSVIFNRLTGLDVGMANYPGTTVDFKKGEARIDGNEFSLVDAPGTYTLEATDGAEEVAVEMLSENPEGVVCVLDAKNLESSIYLLLQVLERDLPTIGVINKADLVEERLKIDRLSQILDIPITETVAVKGKGINDLESKIAGILEGEITSSKKSVKATWDEAEEIKNNVKIEKEEKEKSRREEWGDKLTDPFPGLPLAFLILGVTFGLVIGLGMFLRNYFFLPLFDTFVFPPITALVESYVPYEMVQNILVGEYGFLIKSIEWPIGLVLPYIISFYLALSILEDSGYMPRLAVLLDGIFKKINLSGSHLIPFLLGYGCAIPSIMSTRTMRDRKKRMIVSTAVCLAIPCVAQSGAFIALLAEHSILLVIAVFLFSFVAAFTFGLIMGKVLDTKRNPMIQEVPELLVPDTKMIGKKLWIRLKHFFRKGAAPMVVIIGIAAILYETGVLLYIGSALEPIVSGWLGLPQEAASPLILGVFRRELAVLPLLEMELTTLQLFVASVVALFYVPCIAVLGVLANEFDFKLSFGVLLFTSLFSFLIGGVIFQAGSLFF